MILKRKNYRTLNDPYDLYLMVFKEQLEGEGKKNYKVNNEQGEVAAILGLAHSVNGRHSLKNSEFPWSFKKFQEYMNTMFEGYEHAKRED